MGNKTGIIDNSSYDSHLLPDKPTGLCHLCLCGDVNAYGCVSVQSWSVELTWVSPTFYATSAVRGSNLNVSLFATS